MKLWHGSFAVAIVASFVFLVSSATAAPTICQIGNGCTGTSTAPAYGKILIGGLNGEFEYVASSTFGGGGGGSSFATTSADYWLTTKSTSNLLEGSNLYYTNARADARVVAGIAATSSVKSITTLPSLSLPYSQLTGAPDLSAYFTLSAWYATNTNALAEGGNNLYFTNARADARFVAGLAATTSVKSIITLPSLSLPYSQLTGTPTIASSTMLTDNNTFSGNDSFTNSSSNFGGTWQTFSPAHFQTALGFTPVPNTRNVNTTFPLTGGGALSGDLTLASAFSTTSNTGLPANSFLYTSATGVLIAAASSSLNLPNSALTNSSITLNTQGELSGGASVALGASLTLNASTSPTVGYITSTTTSTSTFSGGIKAPCFSTDGTNCITGTGGTSASSTLLTDNNTFSGTDNFPGGKLQIDSFVISTTTTVCASGCPYTTFALARADGYLGVHFKGATQTLAAPIKIDANNITIEGDSAGTILQFNRATVKTGLENSDASVARSGLVVRNITLQASGASTGGTCYDITHIEIYNLDGANCLTAQIAVIASTSASFYGRIANAQFTIDGGYGSATSSVGISLVGGAGNDTLIENVRIRPLSAISSSTCYYIDSHDVTISRGDCEADALYGAYVTSNGWDFNGDMYLEGNQTNIYLASGLRSVNLTGDYADADNTSTGNIVDNGVSGLTVNASVQYAPVNYISGNNFGISTSSPGTLLSVQGIANFSTATSTYESTGGINLQNGCFAVKGACISGGAGGGVSAVTGTFPIISSGGATPAISSAFGTTTNTGLPVDGFIYTGHTGILQGAASSSLNLPNAALANSSITVNGTAFNLGDSKTITAASSTLLIDNNTFSGTNSFAGALTLANATATSFFAATASSTNLFAASAQLGSLTLGSPLPIASGGTATGTQITNGLNYFDGTRITSSAAATWDGTNFIVKLPNNGLAEFNNAAGVGGIWTTNLGLLTEGSSQEWLLATAGNNINFGTGGTRNSNTTGSNAMILKASTQALGIGTSTPFYALTVSSSTAPQFALTDGSAADFAWTMRSAGNDLFIASSTYNGTSTVAALEIDANGKVTANCFTNDGSTCITGGGGGVTSVSGTWPILSSGGTTPTISWGGLATTSQPASSNLLVSDGGKGVFGVATTTLSGGGPITVSNSPVVIGASGATLGCTTATASVAGCLAAADFTTFNNKNVNIGATTTNPLMFTYAIATSTTVASILPYASTTALTATTLCLTGDTCRTTWPSGGSSASTTLLGDNNTFSGTNSFSKALSITDTTGTTTITNAFQQGGTAGNNFHKITCPSGVNWPGSISTGGCVNFDFTNNGGAGLVINNNHGSGTTGHNVEINVSNTAYDDSALNIDYKGTQNALNITANTPTSNNGFSITYAGKGYGILSTYNGNQGLGAGQFTSTATTTVLNALAPTTNQGVIKATHTGTTTDSNAAVLSLDAATSTLAANGATAAQILFLNSTGSTTGNIITGRNNNTDFFTVNSVGWTGIASSTPGASLAVEGKTLLNGSLTNMSTATSSFQGPVRVNTSLTSVPFFVGTSTTGYPLYGPVSGDLVDGELDFNGTAAFNAANANSGTCASSGFFADGNVPALNSNYAFFGFLNAGWTGSGCAVGNAQEHPLDAILSNPTGSIDFELASTSNAVGYNFYTQNTTKAMSLTNSGQLLIGATTSAVSALEVQGTSSVTTFPGTVQAAGDPVSLLLVNSSATNNTFGDLQFGQLNNLGGLRVTAQISGVQSSHSNSFETGQLAFSTGATGSFGERARINGTGLGIATSSFTSELTVDAEANNFLQLASSTNQGVMLVDSRGFVGIASSTPWARLSLGSGAIVVAEASTTYAATVNINFQAQQSTKIIMTGNMTVNLNNDAVPGEQQMVTLCQDGTGSRTITWASSSTLIWAGHTTPTQTATANECDLYSFHVSAGTSTPFVAGAATQGF